MKKIVKLLFGRLAIGTILLGIQIYWIVYFLFSLGTHSEQISIVLNVISLLALVYIINKDDNPSYKLAWIIFILLFPILGGAMYLYVGNKRPARHLRQRGVFPAVGRPAAHSVYAVRCGSDDCVSFCRRVFRLASAGAGG